MRFLLLPFFIIFLFLETIPFLLTLLTEKLLPYRALIISFLILGITTIILFTSLSSPLEKTPLLITETDLLKQKNELESLLNKQPTHRDILLNLAKIERSLKNEQQALNLENQAQELDPNHSIFSGN